MMPIYKPGCMPKPGPLGSSVKEVNFPAGSLAYRPLRGPALGRRPALQSAKISSTSLALRSSCNYRYILLKIQNTSINELIAPTHIIIIVDGEQWSIDARTQTFHFRNCEHAIFGCLAHTNSQGFLSINKKR